jgi:hypothetical protein
MVIEDDPITHIPPQSTLTWSHSPVGPRVICDVSVGIRVPLLQTKHALGFSSTQQIQEVFPRHNFFK